MVHEAYLRLVQPGSDWQNSAHLFGVAAQVMRHILIDHAHGHRRINHGGQRKTLLLDEALIFPDAKSRNY
jgi:RNA polymerase sigma-70 factor, ECF subfamily